MVYTRLSQVYHISCTANLYYSASDFSPFISHPDSSYSAAGEHDVFYRTQNHGKSDVHENNNQMPYATSAAISLTINRFLYAQTDAMDILLVKQATKECFSWSAE